MAYHFTKKHALVLAAIVVLLVGLFPIAKILYREKPPPISQQDLYKKIYNGWKYFQVYCARCHGEDMVPTLLAPDLRGSLRARERSQFLDVLMNGSQSAVVPGWVMPSWKEVIDDKLADDIFYYINARIDNILPPGRPDEVGLGGLPWEPPQKWSPPK